MLINREKNSVGPSIKERRIKLLYGFLVNFHSKDTRVAYQGDLKEFLEFLLKQFSMTEFRAEHAHFVAYKNYLIERGLSRSSVNRKLASASAYIHYLFQEGERKDNPFLRIKRFKENPEGKTRAISIEELKGATLNIATETPSGKLRMAIMSLFFNSGMRVSELCGLKLSDLDSDRDGVFIRYRAKAEKYMKCYLPETTLSALAEYLEIREKEKGALIKDSYLFVSFSNNAKEKMSRASVNYIFDEVFECLNIEGISPHSARATFITEMVRREGLVSAQKRVGHTDPRSTQRYERIEIGKSAEGLI